MTPYARKYVSDKDLELFLDIKRAVEDLPDIDLGRDNDGKPLILSCHILARAVAALFPVRCVDGRFLKRWQHSWTVTGEEEGHIIDVYPVAVLGGPILIEGSDPSPASFLYKAEPEFYSEKFKEPWFQNSVSALVNAMRS